MIKENEVIVVSTDSYEQVFAEAVPFKAVILEEYNDGELKLKSVITEKEYLLWPYQVLRAQEVNEIIKIAE